MENSVCQNRVGLITVFFYNLFVCEYEKNSAMAQKADLPVSCNTKFVQHIADNVDHNIRTLDGHGTFHGMGIIAALAPQEILHKPIPRITSISNKEMVNLSNIEITFKKSQYADMRHLVFKDLTDMEVSEDPTALLDILWQVSFPLRSPRPAWSGMMQMLHKGNHPGRSSVHFLPLIDMDPGDMTCIYSTLNFVYKQAHMGKFTPVITFD